MYSRQPTHLGAVSELSVPAKLENGTLEESSFLGYLIDDRFYQREYARFFAWGMTEYLMACLPCIISQTKVANR